METGPDHVDVARAVRRSLPFRRLRRRHRFATLAAIALPIVSGAQEPRVATVTVWVISAETGIPLEGAQVMMLRSEWSSTATDSVGRAVLRNLPRRADRLQVRRAGHTSHIVGVPLDTHADLELTISLARAGTATLDTVVAIAPPRHSSAPGFDARRSHGHGRFFDRAEIERLRPRTMIDLLRGISGIRVERGSAGYFVRHIRASHNRDCPMAVYVDGVLVATETGRVRRGSSVFDGIQMELVEAVEIYGVSEVPPQFNRAGAGCGVVLIWMRSEQ